MDLGELHRRARQLRVASLSLVYRPDLNRWFCLVVARGKTVERDSPTLSAAIEQAVVDLENQGLTS